MACLDENAVLQFVEGLLAADAAAEVRAHVATCDECRALVALAGAEFELSSSREADTETAPTEKIGLIWPPEVDDEEGLIGRVLQQSYTVERFIGRGGMGAVYEASHKRLSRRFAIKFIAPSLARDKIAVERMRREAELASRLSHPHIIDVIDFDHTEDGIPFIVMELLEGESLRDLIKREQQIPPAQLISILREATSALAAAHKAGIVHRDLKPSNIMLCRKAGRGDYVKVMDFGVSKSLDGPSITQDLALLGTPRYMAPEQAKGESSRVDSRADIFAMGAITFELLTGQPAFHGRTVVSTLFKVVREEPDTPPSWARVADEVQEAVLHALRKEPEQRPATIEAYWQRLHDALREVGAPVTKATAVAPPQQKRWLLAGAFAIGALLVFGAIALLSFLPTGGEALDDLGQAPQLPVDAALNADVAPAARVDATTTTRPYKKAHRPRAPRYGRLTIQSVSAHDGKHLWAEVYVDGKHAGQTGLSLKRVRSGWHRVELRRRGYRPQRKRTFVRPRRETKLRFRLRRR